ncbi:hypothetical protein FACS1894208_07960 [Clostridia bacterium]|nr:hypothetical protein FACS1894208_07960 [Clostridia bacterium]
MENKKILTIREIAKQYSIAEFAVRNWIKAGEFPVFHAGSRVYVNTAIFEKYLESGGKVYETSRR